MPVVELRSVEHRLYIEAENARSRAQEDLNRAAKEFVRTYEAYNAANRRAKKLKERLRKKLQKADT